MTWLSFCARRPGPAWKTGYGTGDRTLAQIEGVVDHSMEWYMAGAYSVLDGPRQASWTFSIPKYGEPAQHYPLKKITWHAGIMGDRKQDTSLIGNLTLVGKEHEGVAGQPWTDNQIFWSAKIDVALRQLCPQFGKHPPTLRLNMWEHRWLSATSCPSGRNPWNAKFALISSLEDVPSEPEPTPEPTPEPPKEENMIIVIIKAEGDGTQYILNTDGRKYRLGSLGHRTALNRLVDAGAIRLESREMSAADIAAIPDEHA